MTKRAPFWGFILIPIFILSALAAVYFALQPDRNPPPKPANLLAADKGYGVTIDLTGYEPDALERILAAMSANGLTWIRQPVDWVTVEPEPGQFNWTNLDRVVKAASQFKLILVLQNSPQWARPAASSPTTPPTQLSHFGNFARAVANRYGQQVDYYQIWHEPNLSANWGDTYVDPAAYADLLREAALNIGDADSTSHILTAALAATLEDGPLNLNELAYLDQLYRAKANRWFDIVAIQPYGLWTKPLDAPAPDQPNFRRAELVRQVMLNHGDAATPVWATAFGWVALPADWAGQPSPWSHDVPEIQAPRTAAAIQHARQNWPWLGPMLAPRWDTAGLKADDPARGFALTENLSILEVVQQAAANQTIATVGKYPANHAGGIYSSNWRFAQTRADIPQNTPRTLTIPFKGTRLDLNIERGLFRGYLWVTVDGQPANALPQNGQGQSYVVLYDPLREQASVTLARHLPPGRHEAVIEADGGWEQWAVLGWTVSTEAADTRFSQMGFIIAAILAVASGGGLLWFAVRARTQLAKLAWAWSEILIALFAIFGERGQLIIIFSLAAGVYFFQGLIGLALLPFLALAILLRPDIGLAVTTLSIFFYQIPLLLPIGSFSPVELSLVLTVIGVIFRQFVAWGKINFANESTPPAIHPSSLRQTQGKLFILHPLKSTDWAALALVALALLSTVFADNFAVSLREWRTVVVESVIFYVLVRLGLNYQLTINNEQLTTQNPKPGAERRSKSASRSIKTQNRVLSGAQRAQAEVSKPKTQNPKLKTQNLRWVWRLVDAFVTGATLQAILALYLYFFTDRSIDAEGVHRALGLGYGSPNNLALVLDRAWPILLAVAVLPGQSYLRRGFYIIGWLLTSLALYLTFSKGALLLGLPVCVAAMTLLYGVHRWPQYRGRVLAAAVGVLGLFALALIPFTQTQRFRATFDFSEGSTAFFRLKLWQAAWAMLQDHWPLGVGLDNFLYQYRTRYILPEAWQEPDLNHPHNFMLDFGTRLGLGGIAIFVWLQAAFWRNAWRLFKTRFNPLILGLMGSMIVILAHGLVDNSYFLVDLAFAFFLIVGIVQHLSEASPNE